MKIRKHAYYAQAWTLNMLNKYAKLHA